MSLTGHDGTSVTLAPVDAIDFAAVERALFAARRYDETIEYRTDGNINRVWELFDKAVDSLMNFAANRHATRAALFAIAADVERCGLSPALVRLRQRLANPGCACGVVEAAHYVACYYKYALPPEHWLGFFDDWGLAAEAARELLARRFARVVERENLQQRDP